MKIGIDIDDTINERHANDIQLAVSFCKENNIDYNSLNISKMEAKDMLHLNEELWVKFMNISFPRNVNESPTKPNAVILINKLISEGHDVYIITSRKSDYDKEGQPYKGWMMKRDTLKWVERKGFNISEDHILFGISEKGKYCKDNGFDVLVDDSIDHAENCILHHIPCILMTQSYNFSLLEKYKNSPYLLNGKNDWKEVYQIIHNRLK